MRAALCGLFALVGCAASTAETEGTTITLTGVTVLSPAAGATFDAGDAVTLEVASVWSDGEQAGVDSATWAASGWTATGNGLVVTDLPTGELQLEVVATVGDETFTDSVTLTVAPEPDDDTGDPGPGAVDYTGTIAATVAYSGQYGDFDDPCDGWVAYTLSTDGSFSGEGSCLAFGESWDFGLVGQAIDGVITGTVEMGFEDETVETELTGTVADDATMTMAFDQQHWPTEADMIRVWGTVTAAPTVDDEPDSDPEDGAPDGR